MSIQDIVRRHREKWIEAGQWKDPNLTEAPTVSMAIAGCPEDGDGVDEITGALTERLERCKSRGGNVVEGPMGNPK